MRDVSALLAHLDAQPNVSARGVGTTGYCLGGRLSLATAGHFPDRIAAAASYHASNLATDAPDSPHRLAPAMKARVYVAGAIEDPGFDDAQKQRLEELSPRRMSITGSRPTTPVTAGCRRYARSRRGGDRRTGRHLRLAGRDAEALTRHPRPRSSPCTVRPALRRCILSS